MTPAVRELEREGVDFSVHAYDHDARRRDFGHEAADVLGLDPNQVFKTLVVTADGEQAVAIVPVSCALSLKAIGRVLGAKRVEMCDPDVAERVTGYVRGGISPLGQKRRLATVVDEMATAFETIYVSGGKRGLDLGIAPTALVALLDARVADISSP